MIEREIIKQNIKNKDFSIQELVALSEKPIKRYIVDIEEYRMKAGKILENISDDDKEQFIIDLYVLKDKYDETACLDIIKIFNKTSCESEKNNANPLLA